MNSNYQSPTTRLREMLATASGKKEKKKEGKIGVIGAKASLLSSATTQFRTINCNLLLLPGLPKLP